MSRPSGPSPCSSNKRLRPIPSDYGKTISDVTGLARKRAISLLDKCLNNHHLNPAEQRDLIIDVSRAFGLAVAGHDASHDDNSDGDQNPQLEKRSSTRLGSASTESSAGKKEDDHNEVCEVCERGGDLLCCDTCSLVFHLSCIRPKIASIPKGKWSCAHCVSDGVGSGDTGSAKKALVNMGRLSRGLESEDENEDCSIVTKSSRMGEVMIIRSGKRFIVRKVAHSQIVELGRYDNLDDALGSIKPVYRKPVTSSSATGDVASPAIGAVGAMEEDDLWCTHCMDDPAVAVCAFCGCRTCFGKHNSEYLLLCDYCDQESHTYCLTPQLTEIPEEAWYCGSCINLGLVKVEAVVEVPKVEVKEEEELTEASSVVFQLELPAHPQHRVKGRPGRPKKVLTGSAEDYVPPARAMKVAGRGRGRPPGSGRSAEEGGTPRLSLKGSIPAAIRFKPEARPPPTAPGIGVDDILQLQGYYPHSTYGTALIPGAGVKAILSIVENNAGKRAFWPAEKVVITQMREWSPLEDLMTVHAALINQRDLLLQRIRGYDPMFIEPISAAKCVRNAALLATKESSSKDITFASKKPTVIAVEIGAVEVDSFVTPDELISEGSVSVAMDGVSVGGEGGDSSVGVNGSEGLHEIESTADMMAEDVEDEGGAFLDCEEEVEEGGDGEGGVEDGEEGEEGDEGDEDSKEQEDDESKMEEGEEEDEEEESVEGEEGQHDDREEGEGDEGAGEDEEEEGEEDSKDDLEGDEEEEEEGTSSIDFQDAGMMKGEEDEEGEGEGDEGDGSPFDEESSDGAEG